ncbi:hypothetical protein IK1_05661 [Bacillus cereus VD146]|uniref:Uncharacterized protein n=1 Tax=Bacillus cereus (strain VD146) TaxID=1053236 RepID=R8NBT5_BACCX|nr:hypothetical protein IK1_05661 [Bacillus cereus VD146]
MVKEMLNKEHRIDYMEGNSNLIIYIKECLTVKKNLNS